MVGTEKKAASDGLSRLITFEVDGEEMLLIRAGENELNNRTIFSGKVQGRYAVVPVDELIENQREPRELDTDPRIDDLRIIGETTMIAEPESADSVSMCPNGEKIVDFDAKGTYGLLRVPYE